jgi:hypothetical protein
MKTPYDAARRWRKDELDGLRRELGALQQKQDDMHAALANMDAGLAREADAAAALPFSSFAGYAGKVRADQAALRSEILQISVEIDQMHALVSDAFNAYKVLDIAAERFVTDARTAEAKREQDALDEVAARTASDS